MADKKKYNDVFARLKSLIKNDPDHVIYEHDLLDRIPELREPEDERIRKVLLGHFSRYQKEEVFLNNITMGDIVAWLEKLGEQKPAEWSETDKLKMGTIIHVISNQRGSAIFEGFLPEELINWLNGIKDRVQPKPKQEWSDEDEQLYNDLSDTYFYNDEDYPEETYKQLLKRVLDWMTKRAKSLRPQSKWKPSEEYIQALDEVYKTHGANNVCRRTIFNLMNDLKKLKD